MAAPKEKPKEIVITAVRNLRKSLRIEWLEGSDEVGRNFHDNPLPSFYKALAALTPHVCSLCELPAGDAKKIEATGITVRARGENNLALVVARKKIRKGKRVFNISTPLLAMYEDAEAKGADHMESDEAKAIEKVIAEAKKYLRGERAQGQIAFEEEKTEEEKKPGNTDEFPALTEDKN